MRKTLCTLMAIIMSLTLSVGCFADDEYANHISSIELGSEGSSSSVWALFEEKYFGNHNERIGHAGMNERNVFRLIRTGHLGNGNYSYNLDLEGTGIGYITNQHTCPNFKIGSNYMTDVGCEIAAVYNALKMRGWSASCSSIINQFEQNRYLMSLITTGDMGSDPFAIAEYFGNNYQPYTEYDSYSSMMSAVNSARGTHDVFIISHWNTSEIEDGVHTYVLYTRDNDNLIHSLNRLSGSDSVSTFSQLTNSDNFIVGYRVHQVRTR